MIEYPTGRGQLIGGQHRRQEDQHCGPSSWGASRQRDECGRRAAGARRRRCGQLDDSVDYPPRLKPRKRSTA